MVHKIGILNRIFCDHVPTSPDVISLSLGENVGNAKHLPAINKAILKLGRLIGDAVGSTSVVWNPADIIIGFDFFRENTQQYLDGGPFPVLIQVRIDERANGQTNTVGLDYFAGQEIRLEAPDTYTSGDIGKRIVRIVHDIATNGKIDTHITTAGLTHGETISFQPSDDLSILNVVISYNAKAQLH